MHTGSLHAVLLDGSPASPSRVGVLLSSVAAELKKQGCTTEIVELHSAILPTNDPAYHANPAEHPDAKVKHFVQAIEGADIVVLGTPLYHGSFSGLLKLALDHLHNDAFAGKVIGLVSNATGPRKSLQAAQELTVVARTLKGDVSNCLVGTCRADYGVKDAVFQIIEPEIVQRVSILAKDLLAKSSLHRS